MKIKITRLNFHNDVEYDPDGIIEDYFAMPYIAQYKKHWWSGWKYVMDAFTKAPKLFYGKVDLQKVLKEIK